MNENKDPTPVMETLLVSDSGKSSLLKISNVISPEKIEKYTEKAMKLPLIERPEIKVYGKVCRQQRNVGFFAEPGVPGYKYSGQETPVVDIRDYPFLQKMLKKVNKIIGAEYNGILVNNYEDGSRYISAHADDEKDLDGLPVASIAFGATRKFRIRDKKTKKIIADFDHIPGTILVMQEDFQKEFLHEIPCQKTIKEPRVSLTFRKHSN
jgi:alkylated DNA repair dioxygenase AlkB